MWGVALMALSWFVYAHTMMVPGYVDRAGRFKGTDYIYFSVMGSLMSEGRTGALYDPDAHLEEARTRIDPALNLYAAHSNYGPQVAAAFVPLSRLSFGKSLALFLVLTSLAYAASVWWVWSLSPALRSYGGQVAILAAAFPAFFTLIRYAQLSALSLVLLSLVLLALARGRRFVAGLIFGLMVFKPQLAVVIALVMVLTGEWRFVAGAAIAAAGELALAWLVSDTAAMREYFAVLWTLARNPSLVQIYPGEVHSVRGFVQLLLPSWPAAASAAALIALIVAVWLGARAWKSEAAVTWKWGQLVLLSVLASPHLLTYDLILLAIPLIAFADWSIARSEDSLQPTVARLLLVLYLAPFSSNLARLLPIQWSVVAMVALVWVMDGVFRGSRFAGRGS
jgi:hypothetical protein